MNRDTHTLTVTLPAATVDLLEQAVSRTEMGRDRLVDLALQLWLALALDPDATSEDDAAFLAAWRR